MNPVVSTNLQLALAASAAEAFLRSEFPDHKFINTPPITAVATDFEGIVCTANVQYSSPVIGETRTRELRISILFHEKDHAIVIFEGQSYPMQCSWHIIKP